MDCLVAMGLEIVTDGTGTAFVEAYDEHTRQAARRTHHSLHVARAFGRKRHQPRCPARMVKGSRLRAGLRLVRTVCRTLSYIESVRKPSAIAQPLRRSLAPEFRLRAGLRRTALVRVQILDWGGRTPEHRSSDTRYPIGDRALRHKRQRLVPSSWH